MRWMALAWVVCGLGLMFVAGCMGEEEGRFSFYLVDGEIPIEDVRSTDLDLVELQDEPVFTIDDIVGYSQSTHAIRLSEEAYQRFMEIGRGQPFAVCLDGKPLYLGVAWSPLSSASIDGIVALPSMARDSTTIHIDAGYPSVDFFTGEDPRSNKVAMKAIGRFNKLEE